MRCRGVAARRSRRWRPRRGRRRRDAPRDARERCLCPRGRRRRRRRRARGAQHPRRARADVTHMRDDARQRLSH